MEHGLLTVKFHIFSTETLWGALEVGGSNPGPYVGKFEVAYRWSAVYSTEPWPTV